MADEFPKDLPSVSKEPAPAEGSMNKPFSKRDQAAVNDAEANAMPPVVSPPIGQTVELDKDGVKFVIKYN